MKLYSLTVHFSNESQRSPLWLLVLALPLLLALVLLLPVVLLLGAAYYVAALTQGAWSLMRYLTGQKPPPPPTEPLPGPHLWVREVATEQAKLADDGNRGQ